MKKNLIFILSVVLTFAMMLTGCGTEKAPETTAAAADTVATTSAPETTVAEPLTLTDWSMDASTWSSPNGATVHLTATPNRFAEGQKADFVVRLENDDVAIIPCQWDGTVYTASADLNAANGYCYYVILTDADGVSSEVAVNTPAAPINEVLIDLEASLESYCNVIVEESSVDGSKLTLISGQVQVKAPTLTGEEEPVTCQEAALVLSLQGEELARQTVTLTQTETAGLAEGVLENIVFELPDLDGEQTVDLNLHVTLSNGQTLTAFGGNWFHNEEGLVPVVG